VQDTVPLLVGQIDKLFHILPRPGVVHQDVERPAAATQFAEESIDPGAVADIERRCFGREATLQQPAGRQGGAFVLDIRQDHSCAGACQGFGHRQAQTLRRAGDHRQPVTKLSIDVHGYCATFLSSISRTLLIKISRGKISTAIFARSTR
jgi:hypothetical protein